MCQLCVATRLWFYLLGFKFIGLEVACSLLSSGGMLALTGTACPIWRIWWKYAARAAQKHRYYSFLVLKWKKNNYIFGLSLLNVPRNLIFWFCTLVYGISINSLYKADIHVSVSAILSVTINVNKLISKKKIIRHFKNYVVRIDFSIRPLIGFYFNAPNFFQYPNLYKKCT